jgi:hypothetical protein
VLTFEPGIYFRGAGHAEPQGGRCSQFCPCSLLQGFVEILKLAEGPFLLVASVFMRPPIVPSPEENPFGEKNTA